MFDKRKTLTIEDCQTKALLVRGILAKGAIALPMTPSGGVLFAS